ncbi:MAG: hypothetical protein P9X27_04960 [Candidatus Kaelpia aquatica]|nr:hypothetical protein [Candidatus Kaelpia aquatica]
MQNRGEIKELEFSAQQDVLCAEFDIPRILVEKEGLMVRDIVIAIDHHEHFRISDEELVRKLPFGMELIRNSDYSSDLNCIGYALGRLHKVDQKELIALIEDGIYEEVRSPEDRREGDLAVSWNEKEDTILHAGKRTIDDRVESIWGEGGPGFRHGTGEGEIPLSWRNIKYYRLSSDVSSTDSE